MNTLAISCLTTSNLPWFMDPRFMNSRFLWNIALYSIKPCFYHQSHPQLGVFFCFVLAPSLHSFWSYLHWSPVAYWAPTDLRSSSFSVLSFCLFILFMGNFHSVHLSVLPFLSPGDFSVPGIKSGSPALQADSLPSEPSGKPWVAEVPVIL